MRDQNLVLKTLSETIYKFKTILFRWNQFCPSDHICAWTVLIIDQLNLFVKNINPKVYLEVDRRNNLATFPIKTWIWELCIEMKMNSIIAPELPKTHFDFTRIQFCHSTIITTQNYLLVVVGYDKIVFRASRSLEVGFNSLISGNYNIKYI